MSQRWRCLLNNRTQSWKTESKENREREGGGGGRGERDFKPQTNMHRANRLTDNPLEEISDVTDLLRVLCGAFIYLYI